MKIFWKRFLILNFLFICFLFLKSNNVLAEVLKNNGDACSKNSECSSSCCFPDVNQTEELKYYYYGLLNNYSVITNPGLSGIKNICWSRDVCNNGYDLGDLEVAQCGCLAGGTTVTKPTITNDEMCFGPAGISSSEAILQGDKYYWQCKKGGIGVNCFATKGTSRIVSTATCFNYTEAISSKPSDGMLCVCGSVLSAPVLKNSEWVWTCGSEDTETECSAEYAYPDSTIVPETNPLPSSSTTTATQTSTVKSMYPDVNIPTVNVDNYKVLEKLSQKCTILYDKDCEVINSSFSEAITSKLTIKEAIDQGKINKSWKIGRDVDTYETGFTLENIKKLKAYRILPLGFEIAARCIRGEIECSDGEKHYNFINNKTLGDVIDGYYDCEIDANGKIGPFCHLINPDWILKAPIYKCESGSVYSSLLLSTDTVKDSNSRYEYCSDISSCISENDNGSCNAFGYCMKEKNVWRFGATADKCSKDGVGCTKYSYLFNKQSKEIGLIKDSVNNGVCDESSTGCRQYSTSRGTGADWINNPTSKIFLDNDVEICDSKEEGCTGFIRRDVANLIKNSSFEDYTIPSLADSTKKVADLFVSYGNGDINLITTKALNGNLVLSVTTNSIDDVAGYQLDNNNLIAVESNKTYTLSYYVSGNSSYTNTYYNNFGYGAFVNVKEYNEGKERIVPNTSYNYIDIDAFNFVNTDISSTWTRKKVVFKTSIDTKYIDIMPILSKKMGTVYFDSLQLEEGQFLTDYKLYEDSPKNYIKKAPDYMNCYDDNLNNDSVYCSKFVSGCDESNAGCRKYTKTDDSDFWLPGKINEENVCYSECKNYELYKEAGPSYNKEDGENFESLISSTAQSCNSNSSGCSKFYNLEKEKSEEYFSNIKSCVKESSLSATEKEFADYFTYTGSETSGFKLNVYRLLRAKYCTGSTDKCLSDTDCVGSAKCKYNDTNDFFAPAQKDITDISCNKDIYTKANGDPDCREFHGPKNIEAAKNPSETSDNSSYVLYYVNMSDVVNVSNADCSYYEIALDDNILEKNACDKISFLPENVSNDSDFGRYKYDSAKTCSSGNNIGKECTTENAVSFCGTGIDCNYNIISCNIGVYIPESESCSSSENGCREYKGTAIISETLFYDDIEKDDLFDWYKKDQLDANGNKIKVDISKESIFLNTSSIKMVKDESIFKDVSEYFSDVKTKSYYKISLYAKGTGTESSKIAVRIGNGTEIEKDINNDWRFLTFGTWSSDDIKTLKEIDIINKSNGAIYVDYIKLEKSQSEYLIKDTWTTPISCDNTYENPQGICTQEAEAQGFCNIKPNKICLAGDNIGKTCSSNSDCNDNLCDYQNKYCTSKTDKTGQQCELNSDCYTDGIVPDGETANICEPSNNGYRLNPGKMLGCDQYSDSYNNDGYYIFNDVNLCSVDKMGCEAVYDTYNSSSYKKQIFNESNNFGYAVAYYNFNDKNNLGKDSINNDNLTSNNASYFSGINDGAIKLSGSISSDGYEFNSMYPAINNSLTISAWIKPEVAGGSGSIVKKQNSFELSYSGTNLTCSIGNSGFSYTSIGVLVYGSWNHVVCSYDGLKISLYINGYLKSVSPSRAVVINYSDSDRLTVGSNELSIDDLAIYKKTLTQKEVLTAYEDYKDNVVVKADELKYLIIDSEKSCDSKYLGCTALGRRSDRYDNYGDYGVVYYILSPDKFKSYASSSGVNSGSLCKIEENGCYSFNNNGSKENFKFPEKLCYYLENVDVGNGYEKKSGWFRYDYISGSMTNEGCYTGKLKELGISSDNAIKSDKAYKLYKPNDCEYKTDIVKRDVSTGGSSYGYGIIGQLDNKVISFDNSINSTLFIVTGWFKKDSTKGCSDNGDYNIESFDYMNLYNNSVGSCSEYGCTEFIDPSENVCKSGNKNGYKCVSNNECGPNSECTSDGYCKFDNANLGYGLTYSKCKTNLDCGFGGDCSSNNTYTYINNDKIDKKSCSTVSESEGCILFNDTSNSTLKYASEETYLKSYKSSGKGVTPQVGVDGDTSTKKKDSNIIIKVDNDRECAEWLTFGDNKEFNTKVLDVDNGIGTCTEIRSDDKTCYSVGGGWSDNISTSGYINRMRGNWSDNDFSGISIFNEQSVDRMWWKDKEFVGTPGISIESSSKITQGTVNGKLDNLICKKYPEKDSPVNFTDKYEYDSEYENITGGTDGYGYYCSEEIYTDSECNSKCYFGDELKGLCVQGEKYRCCVKKDVVLNGGIYGYGLPFDVYKNKKARIYFKSANSGFSVMEHNNYSPTNPIRYIISDMQECYYQRVSYNGLYEEQFYQGYNSREPIFNEVCQDIDDSGYGCYVKDSVYSKNYKLKETLNYSQKDNKENNYRQGYCLEFDYSKEIYYVGSGKYNCINWVPGLVK